MLLLALLTAAIGFAQQKGIVLSDLTWPEAEKALKADTIVVIPIGAESKEHGPHLKLKNDSILADYFKRKVLERADVVVAPTVNYHYYPAFVEYPGSTTLRLETARAVAAFEPPMPWLGTWATRPRPARPPHEDEDPGLAAERFFEAGGQIRRAGLFAARGPNGDPSLHARQNLPQPFRHRREIGFKDHHSCAGVRQNRGQLALGQTHVQRHDNGSRLHHSVVAFEQLVIIDLRHPLDLLPDPRTLPGALQISPEELEVRQSEISRSGEIVLFCT